MIVYFFHCTQDLVFIYESPESGILYMYTMDRWFWIDGRLVSTRSIGEILTITRGMHQEGKHLSWKAMQRLDWRATTILAESIQKGSISEKELYKAGIARWWNLKWFYTSTPLQDLSYTRVDEPWLTMMKAGHPQHTASPPAYESLLQ